MLYTVKGNYYSNGKDAWKAFWKLAREGKTAVLSKAEHPFLFQFRTLAVSGMEDEKAIIIGNTGKHSEV